MKKVKDIIITLMILPLLALTGCFLQWATPPEYPTHKEFKTEYTEEEHIKRIDEITKRFIVKDWFRYNYSTVSDYDIEIMYSFYDGDPEYFILTFYLENPYRSDENRIPLFSKHPELEERYVFHAYGIIIDDEYKIINAGSYWAPYIYKGFSPGKSLFEAMGYGDYKKYYGNKCFGIENEKGEIVQICDYNVCEMEKVDADGNRLISYTPTYNYYCHIYNDQEPICDKCFIYKVLTLEEQKALMGWGVDKTRYYDYIFTNV